MQNASKLCHYCTLARSGSLQCEQTPNFTKPNFLDQICVKSVTRDLQPNRMFLPRSFVCKCRTAVSQRTNATCKRQWFNQLWLKWCLVKDLHLPFEHYEPVGPGLLLENILHPKWVWMEIFDKNDKRNFRLSIVKAENAHIYIEDSTFPHEKLQQLVCTCSSHQRSVLHLVRTTLKLVSSYVDPTSVAVFVIGASFFQETMEHWPRTLGQIFGVRLLQMLLQFANCC